LKNYSIRILKNLWEQVHGQVLSTGADESVAFLTANYFETGEKIIFLPQIVVSAKSTDYLRQGPLHLQVSPLYVNRVISAAEDQRNTAIMVHSHPFEEKIPWYSPTDDYGEELTSETISKCLEDNPPVGSILFGKHHGIGRVWTGLTKKKYFLPINIIGEFSFDHLSYITKDKKQFNETVDRQIKALGTTYQNKLESLDIGIVGLGGTGSAIAEQLVRMGIKKVRLVDHDQLEASNLSRVYGSQQNNLKKNNFKVDIVGKHLLSINNEIEINTLKKSVQTKEALVFLSNCDIIFSCLDRHAPRAVINELSYQCFIPVIDVGVGLQRTKQGVIDGIARATIIGPGMPCLLCQNIVSPEMITAENLSPEEYESRRAEGYASNLQQNVPSVINYTTLASSLGLLIFNDLLLNNTSNTFSSLLFDISSKETIKLSTEIKEDCVCQKRLGKGLSQPFSVAD
jgi:molybdopterin/thiamine biosynthesis adenylyltransferase